MVVYSVVRRKTGHRQRRRRDVGRSRWLRERVIARLGTGDCQAGHSYVDVNTNVLAGERARGATFVEGDHVAAEYAGSVQFSSSDPQAALPAPYTFQTTDKGEHIFSVTFNTPGQQTLTATDIAPGSTLSGTTNVRVFSPWWFPNPFARDFFQMLPQPFGGFRLGQNVGTIGRGHARLQPRVSTFT